MSRKHSPRAKRAALRNAPEEDPEFQIAPMIDILLVLLVFFMSISSTEVLQTNDAVKLPIAKDATPKGEKAQKGQTIVNVLWSKIQNGGTIDINDKPYGQPTEIVPVLQQGLNNDPNMRILVRADKEVRYEYMKGILKAVGQAGGTNVTFSVVDKDVATPGGAPATP